MKAEIVFTALTFMGSVFAVIGATEVNEGRNNHISYVKGNEIIRKRNPDLEAYGSKKTALGAAIIGSCTVAFYLKKEVAERRGILDS